MSRRRYISTSISRDSRVAQLARQAGDFAVLLYTWLIPHAEDDAIVYGDPDEIVMTVLPGIRHRGPEDVAAALEAMHNLGLIHWDQANRRVLFPPESFYKHQTYIPREKRRTWHPTPPDESTDHGSAAISGEQRTSPKNADGQRRSAPTAVSPSPSPSPSPSLSREEEEEEEAAAPDDDRHHETNWIAWYEHETGALPSQREMRDAAALIERGVTEELIIAVIQEAIKERRRMPVTYALRCIANAQPYGVRTVEDWRRHETINSRPTRASPPPRAAGLAALQAELERVRHERGGSP